MAHPPVGQTATSKEPSEPHENGNGNESVHGPSFLGLAEDPKTEFHYLYEDEPPRSHAGLIFFLILLLGAGGFGYWQWRHNGYPFNRLNASTSASTPSASPSEVAPAQNQDQQTHNEKPMTGVGDVLPTAPEKKTQPTPPAQGAQPPAAGSESSAASANQPRTPAEAAPQKNPAEETPEKTEEAKATPPPEVSAKPRTPKASKPAPAPKAAPVAPNPGSAPDADLELTGERYLYGNGVPRNCGRAETSLRTAALHGNSKAQTVLGTMYATGHCVGRDLPTAYRWFARALHQEPQNSRISADLQVLWRQMTPQERQLATASGQ